MSAFSALTDQELTVLLKQGDRLAFSEIYSRHWHNLFLHAYKMLDNEDEAKDVIQELFISLWSKAADLRIKTNLKAYLYVSARNRVINHIRKHRISDDFLTMIAGEMEEADDYTVQTIEERDLVALIDQEINLLPPRMKAVFEMSRKEFLSNKEIAARLGTSEETVKKQISNSIRTLKLKLNKHAGTAVILLEILRHRV